MSNDSNIELIKLVRITGIRETELTALKAAGGSGWSRVMQTVASHEDLLSKGEKHTRQKAIQDPVHGAILLEPWELDVISTWEMLRLRFVMQLGPAHIVYPGATHTRFQHCLGTNFLAQKSIRVVNYCDDLEHVCFVPLSRLLDDYQQKIFRITALLHDVGHPPTSHTIEFALKGAHDLDHLDLGESLILHSGLTDVLTRNDIEPQTVVDVLRRKSKDPVLALLSEFLDNPFDIDKTDYLIRDAHYSGVQLGVFPAERVMLTNRVVKNKKGRYIRGYMLKAFRSLESLVLSRNWMFSDLYLHHAVRLAEAMVSKATYFRIKEEKLSKSECIGLFTRMTDADLYRWLLESETEFIHEYAARIRYRRLFKVVLSRPIAFFEDDTKSRFLKMLDEIQVLLDAEEELDDEPGAAIIDVVYPEFGANTLGKLPLLAGGEGIGLDIVKLEDTQEGKSLMQTLSRQESTIPSVRVYASPEIAVKVHKKFDQLFPVKEHMAYRDDEYDMTET